MMTLFTVLFFMACGWLLCAVLIGIYLIWMNESFRQDQGGAVVLVLTLLMFPSVVLGGVIGYVFFC